MALCLASGLGLKHHFLSEPSGSGLRRLPEGDRERIGALKAAHLGDRKDLVAGFAEQPFRFSLANSNSRLQVLCNGSAESHFGTI